VAQGVGPEFKPQHHKKKRKRKEGGRRGREERREERKQGSHIQGHLLGGRGTADFLMEGSVLHGMQLRVLSNHVKNSR
jgi:hypothetical protein